MPTKASNVQTLASFLISLSGLMKVSHIRQMWFLFLKVYETIHKLSKWVGKTTKLPTGNNESNYLQK